MLTSKSNKLLLKLQSVHYTNMQTVFCDNKYHSIQYLHHHPVGGKWTVIWMLHIVLILLPNYAFFFFPHSPIVTLSPPMGVLKCLLPSLPQLNGLICFSSVSQNTLLILSPLHIWLSSSSPVSLVFINRVYLLFPVSCDFLSVPVSCFSPRPTTWPLSYDMVPVLGTPLFPPPPPWSTSRPQQPAPGPWSGSKASSSP